MNTNNDSTIMDDQTIGLKKIIVDYIRQWRVFVVAFFISLVIAVLYLVLVPRTWESTASFQLQINDGSGGGSVNLGQMAGLMQSFGIGGSSSGSLNLDDEKAIVTSFDVMNQVVDKLALYVEYYKPGRLNYVMYDDSPVLLSCDVATKANILSSIEFEIKLSAAGAGTVKVESDIDKKKYSFQINSLPQVIKIDQGEFTLSHNPANEERTSVKMDITVNPLGWTAEKYKDEIVVDDVSKSSNMLTLTYLDYEPKRAIDLLNTVIKVYDEQDKTHKKRLASSSMTFVDQRITNVLTELHLIEKEMADYKTESGVTDIQVDLSFYSNQVQELQSRIISLETELQVIGMLNDFISDPENEYNLIPTILSVTSGEAGGTIGLYNEKLLERSQLMSTSKIESPLLIQSNKQVAQMRESVFLSIKNTRSSIETTLKDLKSKEKGLLSKMGGVPSFERDFIEYRRQQEIYQGVYLLLLQKREEMALAVGDIKDKVRVIDTPFVKKKAVAPRKLYAAILIMLLTMVLPVVWIESRKLYKELKKEFAK